MESFQCSRSPNNVVSTNANTISNEVYGDLEVNGVQNSRKIQLIPECRILENANESRKLEKSQRARIDGSKFCRWRGMKSEYPAYFEAWNPNSESNSKIYRNFTG
ncbi:hypothetical protein TNCV_1500211 [Trichonephila clavipes]|nr:hypothetical protein TNCV_1500211 [Trichonephila clavipes]